MAQSSARTGLSPAWVLAAWLLSGCILGDETGKRPPTDSAPGIGEYRVSGNRLTFRLPPDTIRQCVFDSLWTVVLGGESETMEFSLHDGFLNLYPPPNGSVQAHILLAGSEGNSLEGRWKIQEFKYRVLSDSLTDSAKTWWEQFSAMQNKVQSFTPTEFEFRSGRVTRSAPPPAAGFFLAQWNGEFSMGVGVPDSALFDVDVRVIDPATLEMRGRLNGETVTITFAADGTKTLSSDDVARPDYVDGNPVSCPEVPAPWYTPFLVANLR